MPVAKVDNALYNIIVNKSLQTKKDKKGKLTMSKEIKLSREEILEKSYKLLSDEKIDGDETYEVFARKCREVKKFVDSLINIYTLDPEQYADEKVGEICNLREVSYLLEHCAKLLKDCDEEYR